MPLRVLHLEDNPRDAALIGEILTDEVDCSIRCVETEQAFIAAIAARDIDLVLADLSLPSFDGRTALGIVQRELPGIPFIFVSGTIGEEAAIDSIKLGATDYVLKGRLSRLPMAVRRAVDEAAARAEKKRLEQQLLCVQRLEGFDLIAAGITHDLKNLLHPIKFASHLVTEQYEDKKLHDLMHLIRDSADRGIEMIGQVMNFFRVAETAAQEVPVTQIVNDLSDLIRSAYPKIQVETEIAPTLPPLHGHPNEIHQALLNLATNARDAMKGEGTLTFSAVPVTLEADSFSPVEASMPGDYLCLSVRDSGPGIPPEVLARIFEPMFTTKGQGKGTGLGLVSVQTVLHNHHGFARVENVPAPGHGAVFRLYFPTSTAASGAPGPVAFRTILPTGTGQHIGVVTEEAGLRAAFSDILGTCGYRVHTAGYGATALRQFSERQTELELVIIDKELSLVDGLETARALQHRRAVPILLVTVDPAVSLGPTLESAGVRAILHRPFDTPRLLHAVADALRAATAKPTA
jgi:signal transduction histidine kinase